MTLHFMAIAALAFYLVSSLLFLVGLARKDPERADGLSRKAALALVGGLIFHTLSIVPFLRTENYEILRDRGDFFFWISWSIALAYMLMHLRFRSAILGAFMATASGVFMGSSSYLVHQGGPLRPFGGDILIFAFHAVPILVAEVSLVLSFVLSSVFLIQERRLKTKVARSLTGEAPSLAYLEALNRKFIVLGFIAMTAGIVSGTVWAVSNSRPLLASDFSQWTAFIVWIFLAVILQLRISGKWSSRRVSRATVLIAGALLVSFFIAAFFSGKFLHDDYAQSSVLEGFEPNRGQS